MNIAMLVEMAAGVAPDRVAIGRRSGEGTYGRLFDDAGRAASLFRASGAERIVHTAEASPVLPVALFGAAWSGRPFVPLNYRLADEQLRALVARQAPAMVVVDPGTAHRVAELDGIEVVDTIELADRVASMERAPADWSSDPDDVAILLHTSGTSGDPKVAILRHRHLTSYVTGSVDFLAASEDEASLASVPPYHIASMSGILTAMFGGRRLVQLPSFDAREWVDVARAERITHAMTVPTMLMRILDVVDPATGGDGLPIPHLRHVSYGGGRMPVPVIERAMALLPGVDFVNAYGLTETSSSIAVLTPADHRTALSSSDPEMRRRLGSVGRPLPAVQISVRDDDGHELPAGTPGEIWVRGDQVSGEYSNTGGVVDGWFRTNDGGWFDDEGYLYVDGRLDDVIVRGGENLSPGEIEDVVLQHPAVSDAVVVGTPDTEWGEVVAAVVVLHPGRSATPDELADHVVRHLRSSRRPAVVQIRESLPMGDTGKVLRRQIRAELAEERATGTV